VENKVKEIMDVMTSRGVLFDELAGVLASAHMREEMLKINKNSKKYKSLESKVRDLDKIIESIGKDGRIHETIDANGSATGRMSHSKPNLAGVPKDYKIRKCFKASEGYNLVGIDAKSLELRMLAHYMDDDKYIEEITYGDIHRANQVATGLKSRDTAKAFIFALIYGAGDDKLGKTIGRTSKEARGIKRNFFDNMPSFENLRSEVKRVAAKGWITGLNGRKIIVDQQYKALNYLLQSAGALVMKRALVILEDKVKHINYHHVLNIHDEMQVEVAIGFEDEFGRMAIEAFKEAGEYYDMKCPMDAEYKIGHHWGLTH